MGVSILDTLRNQNTANNSKKISLHKIWTKRNKCSSLFNVSQIICNDILDSSSSIVTSKRFILGNETSLNVDYTKKSKH